MRINLRRKPRQKTTFFRRRIPNNLIMRAKRTNPRTRDNLQCHKHNKNSYAEQNYFFLKHTHFFPKEKPQNAEKDRHTYNQCTKKIKLVNLIRKIEDKIVNTRMRSILSTARLLTLLLISKLSGKTKQTQK